MESASTTTAAQDWVAELKAGREQTLAALRARLRDGLAAAFRGRQGVDDADLEDFAQEAVLRVLDRLDTFRGDSSFTTWAMAVAVRVSLTALRRRRWSGAPIDARLAEWARPAEAPPVGRQGERTELFAALHRAIAADLTPRQRQVVLGELEGIPQVVLADRLSSTPGAIYKASHDARKKLKAALSRAGFEADGVARLLADAG